jgi:general secretion pathway protein H
VTSPTSERRRSEAGYALYELVLALAIFALVAAVVVPRIARAPGPIELRAATEAIAALLRTDRNAALRERRGVVSLVDLTQGVVISGSTGARVQIPSGTKIEFVQSSREARAEGGGIRFDPDGRSSGGVLTLKLDGTVKQVSVNWLTGGVLIASQDQSGNPRSAW